MSTGSHNDTAGGPTPGSDRPTVEETGSLTAATMKARVRQMLSHENVNASGDVATSISPEISQTAAATSPAASQERSTGSPDVPLLATGPEIPSCVRARIGRSETPLAAEQEVYDGTDAYIIILPHPSDNSLVDAYVVGSSCTNQSPPAAGTLLLRHTYPRQ
jgi:hypothetical protein